MRSTGFSGAIFNNGTDGSYLEFHNPSLRPYGDSRYVDVPLVDGYFRALRRLADFRELSPQVAFDAVLLPIVDSREVVASLLQDPGWRLAYADANRAFVVNLKSGAGTQRRPSVSRFSTGGENLSAARHAVAAIAWIRVLARANDRTNLLRALQQFAHAPQIPAEIVEASLDYGLKNNDSEVLAAARALRPRMLSLKRIDEETVDWELKRAAP